MISWLCQLARGLDLLRYMLPLPTGSIDIGAATHFYYWAELKRCATQLFSLAFQKKIFCVFGPRLWL